MNIIIIKLKYIFKIKTNTLVLGLIICNNNTIELY